MKVLCYVCSADLGEKDGLGVEGTSHGLCPECLKRELEKLPNIAQQRA